MDCGTTSSLHVHVQTFGCFITFPVPLRTGVRPTQKFIRKWRHNVLARNGTCTCREMVVCQCM